jgi:hypothetical protein
MDEITMDLDGVPMRIRFRELGVDFHGKAASHSGYHCEPGRRTGTIEQDEAWARAWARSEYDKAKHYPYVVGAEGKAFGWKDISKNWQTGKLEIRLPAWASESIKAALTALGMEESDSANHRWAFSNPSIGKEAFKELVSPLLKTGTRFMDEEALAAQLRDQLTPGGALVTEQQMDLFGAAAQ